MKVFMYDKEDYANLERFKMPVVTAVKSVLTIPLERKERYILMKFFYQNGSNLSTAMREYRRLEGLRKVLKSRQALKKMITKFKETGELGMLQGRKRLWL
ncbi:hypothetical protein AVEN_119776-1 [Araneus ventricosus]|uniref:DUF4817 domain-containing protein n=1 Tax=Araneus ventricosus TaxID=182803 RepID=A0A4Y2KB54_ARAVE|nr:hypothetical protein AVEN_119776-1 [Araneus ventricosus]